MHVRWKNRTSIKGLFCLSFYTNYSLVKQFDTIKLRPDGTFIHGWHLWSFIEKGNLELSDGKNLQILGVKGKKVELFIPDTSYTPKFTGNLSKVNSYFDKERLNYYKLFKTYLNKHPDFREEEALHSDKYYSILDSIISDRITFTKAYFENSKKEYENKLVTDQIASFIYTDLLLKCYNPNSPLSKFKYYQQLFHKNGSSTYKFTNEISFSNPTLFNNYEYMVFAHAFFELAAGEYLKAIYTS